MFWCVVSLYIFTPGGAISEAWNRVTMITPVKIFGRVRLSTGLWKTNMADFCERDAFVKFRKRPAYITFKHLRKSSSCPTSKSWTF